MKAEKEGWIAWNDQNHWHNFTFNEWVGGGVSLHFLSGSSRGHYKLRALLPENWLVWGDRLHSQTIKIWSSHQNTYLCSVNKLLKLKIILSINDKLEGSFMIYNSNLFCSQLNKIPSWNKEWAIYCTNFLKHSYATRKFSSKQKVFVS